MSFTVMITGGGGFVAHHTLVHLLKNTDWNFVATDSFRHVGISARLRAVFEELPEARHRVKVVIHDLATPIDKLTAKEFGNINATREGFDYIYENVFLQNALCNTSKTAHIRNELVMMKAPIIIQMCKQACSNKIK